MMMHQVLRRKFQGWLGGFIFVGAAFLAVAPFSAGAAERLAGKLKNETLVYGQPDGSGEVVSKLSQGVTLWVTGAEQSGFLPILLPKPVNSLTTGWIRVADVHTYTLPPAKQQVNQRAIKENSLNNLLMASGGFQSVSPHEWQAAMGESQGSLSLLRFGAEIRHRMGTSFFLGLSGSYDQFSAKTLTVTGAYSVSGMGVGIPLLWSWTFGPRLSMSAGLIPGLEVFSSKSSSATTEVSTTNILAFTLGARLEGGYWFTSSLGILGQLNYFTSTLTSVATLNSTGSQVVADVNLSSLGVGLGLAFAF